MANVLEINHINLFFILKSYIIDDMNFAHSAYLIGIDIADGHPHAKKNIYHKISIKKLKKIKFLDFLD
jgi:hypothetical protein